MRSAEKVKPVGENRTLILEKAATPITFQIRSAKDT
jgi:hypothetical protein